MSRANLQFCIMAVPLHFFEGLQFRPIASHALAVSTRPCRYKNASSIVGGSPQRVDQKERGIFYRHGRVQTAKPWLAIGRNCEIVVPTLVWTRPCRYETVPRLFWRGMFDNFRRCCPFPVLAIFEGCLEWNGDV